MKDEAVSLWPIPPEQYATNREAHNGAYEATEPGSMIVSAEQVCEYSDCCPNLFSITRQRADANPTGDQTVGSTCMVVLNRPPRFIDRLE